eukprot:300105-Amphidinium_carterae.1
MPRVPKALAPNVERYMVSEPDVPASLCSELGALSRSCLLLVDGSTMTEVDWSTPRASLHEVLDCGSIGWPARQYMYHDG